MSQYTISLQSIINIKSHNPPYNDDVFADTRKKIERGREIFFNFDYEGDDKFKELFETAFIIQNIDNNIYCYDADLFMLALENDFKTKAPLFYKQYKAIEELKAADLTDTTTSEGTINENRSDTATAELNAESNSNGKSKSSQFPQDIATSGNFGNIDYMDAGNASENKTTSKSKNMSSGTGTTQHRDTRITTRNITKIEKLGEFLVLQQNIINDFVKSFSDLFMLIW